jgi:hypothetical protein
MGQLHERAPHWCWLYCGNARCERAYSPAAIALAPYVIRWGANASSNLLRRSARCSTCGHKGATLRVKQDDPAHDDYAVFPTSGIDKPLSVQGVNIKKPFGACGACRASVVNFREKLTNRLKVKGLQSVAAD